MNLNSSSRLGLFSLIIASALVLLVAPQGVPTARGESSRAAKPDEFIRKWLVLKSLPVPRETQNTPSDEAQKRAFAQDWLVSAGGEVGIKPRSGMRVPIDGKIFAWQAILSPEDTLDLRQGSDPAEFAVAYVWTAIDLKKQTRALLGIGSDDGVKLWVNDQLIIDSWIARSAADSTAGACARQGCSSRFSTFKKIRKMEAHLIRSIL